jgi:amino acid transporter
VWALAVIVLCAAWNLRGARAVGEGSVRLFCVLLAPFVVLTGVGLWKVFAGGHLVGGGGWLQEGFARLKAGFTLLKAPVMGTDLAGAVSVTLWVYMGWDNASTVAQEVEEPQRNYPRAMLMAVGLVAATYVLPLAAVGMAGIPADRFSTGAWTDAARELVGPWLALGVVLGGTISGFGMFNALVMSYTRVPYALAEEGLLPKAMTWKTEAGVPWVSVVLCSVAWALALRLSFERLISIDLVLYGASLVLEFVALVVLRVKEPSLARPFRVPGGVWGAVGMGAGPTVLIGFALWAARGERVAGLPALGFAGIVAAVGPIVYLLAKRLRGMLA